MKKSLTLSAFALMLALFAVCGAQASEGTEPTAAAQAPAASETVVPSAAEMPQPSLEELLREDVAATQCDGLVVTAYSAQECFWACREYRCVKDYFEAPTDCCFCKRPKTLSY